MTDQIFPKQDFVPDNNHAASLSDAGCSAAENIMPSFDPLFSLNRLIAQDTNYREAIFPHSQVIWEDAKTKDGEPFMHLHEQIVWQWKSEATALSLPITLQTETQKPKLEM